MGIGGLVIKIFNKPEVKKMFQDQIKKKSEPTVVDVTVPKKKYSSIGSSQMRSGRSSTIQTSSMGLMSKASIGKKTLLGG